MQIPTPTVAIPLPIPLPIPIAVVATAEQQFILEILKLVVPATAAVLAALFAHGARRDIKDLHVEINSRLTQLMVAEKKVSEQEGRDAQKLSNVDTKEG